MECGVYTITQRSTGKRYVGSSVNLYRRKYKHFRELRHGIHHCEHLQRAFLKYGEADFNFAVLLKCDKDRVLFYEQRAMDILNPTFNACRVAGNHTGRLASPETRMKMSKAHTGKAKSLEHCKSMSAVRLGIPMPLETRAKISASTTGVPKSLETRARMSKSLLGNTKWLGKKHSPETREKMRVAWGNRRLAAC